MPRYSANAKSKYVVLQYKHKCFYDKCSYTFISRCLCLSLYFIFLITLNFSLYTIYVYVTRKSRYSYPLQILLTDTIQM